LNPLIATDVYDYYVMDPLFCALVRYGPSNEFVYASGDTEAEEPLAWYPDATTDLGTFDETALTYTFTLREDVFFHDGHQLDGYDVAFTAAAHMTPKVGSSQYSPHVLALGEDAPGELSGNNSVVVTDEDTDGHFETVTYHLDGLYAPFLSNIANSVVLPEHVLGDGTGHSTDSADWAVLPVNWREHFTNTGIGGNPIGAGPFKFPAAGQGAEWATAGTAKLEKHTEWHGFSDDFPIDEGDVTEFWVEVKTNKDAALTALFNGEITNVDPQFTMQANYDQIKDDAASDAVLSPEVGWQAMFYNLKHPLLTKNVRHAMSHMIPREKIIQYLLEGFGLPGATPIAPGSWAFNPNIDYHVYDKDIALDYLAADGYDVTPWRGAGPAPSPFAFLAGLFGLGTIVVFVKYRRQK
jgi:ABC-type transport system substrate-binding protein